MQQLIEIPDHREVPSVMRYSRAHQPEDTIVRLSRDVTVGGSEPLIIAGPCGVESMEQLRTIAHAVRDAGAKALRGGAFKPRTSPYSFQGMGEEGLKILKTVSEETGLPTVSEIIATELIPMFREMVDMLQIGSRNMQNYELLKAAAKTGKPILLKRGMHATEEEFLLAAEYILNEGNEQVVLCERGIRTHNKETRNTLDLNTLAYIKEVSHLPVIADPSHSAGRRDLVAPLGSAALAAGANGLMVEVHHKPEEALSDGKQSLTPEEFRRMMQKL
jgi:3-deoxy-7-phosphoheptulonate synthase